MWDIAFSRTSYQRFGLNTRLAGARTFWIGPGRLWTILFQKNAVPEEWKGNFRTPSQRIRGVLVLTVGNAMKTVVWTRID